jgi:hypothetical protein
VNQPVLAPVFQHFRSLHRAPIVDGEEKEKIVSLVFDKSKAEFIITSTVSHHAPSSPAVIIENTNVNNSGGSDAFQNGMRMGAARSAARGATSASISVIDPHSSQVIFAYSVGKAGNTNQVQSAAEACAKHLKDFIEKSSK